MYICINVYYFAHLRKIRVCVGVIELSLPKNYLFLRANLKYTHVYIYIYIYTHAHMPSRKKSLMTTSNVVMIF